VEDDESKTLQHKNDDNQTLGVKWPSGKGAAMNAYEDKAP
jgi:hypothetical protein